MQVERNWLAAAPWKRDDCWLRSWTGVLVHGWRCTWWVRMCCIAGCSASGWVCYGCEYQLTDVTSNFRCPMLSEMVEHERVCRFDFKLVQEESGSRMRSVL